MEVGFGKQASKLVLSLEVSLSRSHSATRGRGQEAPTPASPPYLVLEGRCERRGCRPQQVLPSRTCRCPNLGRVGRGRRGPLPGRRRTRHLHGERDLLLRAHHVPQRGVEKRGGEERRGPPGRAARRARPGHSGLPPTRRQRRRRAERPRELRGAGGGRARWAACSAPPACSRAPGSLGEQKKERGGGGEEGGEEEGGRRGGEGGRRGRRRREGAAPLSAAAAQPRLGGSGESGGPRREGGRRCAGGDSQTPVSLAAGERALPRPAHCGRRVLYNSAVRRRGHDSCIGPGPSPGLATRAGMEAGAQAGGRGPGAAPALRRCSSQPRGAPSPPLGPAGSEAAGSRAAEPRGGATLAPRRAVFRREGAGRRQKSAEGAGAGGAAGWHAGGAGRGRGRGRGGLRPGHCCGATRSCSSGRGAWQGKARRAALRPRRGGTSAGLRLRPAARPPLARPAPGLAAKRRVLWPAEARGPRGCGAWLWPRWQGWEGKQMRRQVRPD